MLVIFFTALLLALIMQAVLLQRAAVREQQLRAEAELLRATAELESLRARAILDAFRQQEGKRQSVEAATDQQESK
jgi:hypothetical protein